MKILTGSHIKQLDQYTIENEPVESIDLMERASEAMAQIVAQKVGEGRAIVFVIGKGNNGGDGLAMARMLANAGFACLVRMASQPEELSRDCRYNYDRLPDNITFVNEIPLEIEGFEIVVVDALLGSGVKGKLTEPYQNIIDEINSCGHYIISVDLPSGMKSEFRNDPRSIVWADLTLTIEFPKLAMLLPEAGECCGEIEIVNIGLSAAYIEQAKSPYIYVQKQLIEQFKKNRLKFSHKGTYGHALLMCSSKGMYGAAVLSASAALRSGCGLVTMRVPADCAAAVYSNAPSAIVSDEPQDFLATMPADIGKYTAIGIGPGIGTANETKDVLESLLKQGRAGIIIDADALNIIASDNSLRKLVPAGSIFTPHPGELKRLVGDWGGEEEKIRKASDLAIELQSVVIVKGACTMICTPSGDVYFNHTGTPGMAKGGSGDVLTGLITGLVARGYDALEASLLGVYLHGLAGEKAADYYGEESMNSSDIIDFIGDAFSYLD